MKVILVNGSPHAKGCTYTALSEIRQTLNEEGIEAEIFQLGTTAVQGCTACGNCAKTGLCVLDDCINKFVELAENADGFIFGSPVYFASANGSLISFMDRAFYVGNKRNAFYLKPAAAVVSARRAGTTATFDVINKYFTISQMPVIPSQYWNNVHGSTPDDVTKDLEGLQTMRTLARNMAWFLKCKEAGAKANVPLPKIENKLRTNFI